MNKYRSRPEVRAKLPEIIAAYKRGESTYVIGERYGVSHHTVLKWIKDAGVQMRPGGRPRVDYAKALPLYRAGASDVEIADCLGCSEGAIEKWRVANGLPTLRQCRECGNLFDISYAAHYRCAECDPGLPIGGQVGFFEVLEYKGRVRGHAKQYLVRDTRCGHVGEIGHTFKTPFRGRYALCGCPIRSAADNGGYAYWSWQTQDGGNVQVAEHRIVMERELGRELLPDETVHHINGDRRDNRPENLQLRQGRHGKGAAFLCHDCGSHNVVAVPLASPSGNPPPDTVCIGESA